MSNEINNNPINFTGKWKGQLPPPPPVTSLPVTVTRVENGYVCKVGEKFFVFINLEEVSNFIKEKVK